MSSQYKRAFITLKQENSAYSLIGDAMGRCIIESRGTQGKISFLVQNLMPEVIYKAYIVANKDGYSCGVQLGSISVDKRGRGELKKLFNTYNVEDTGLDIESFKVAVVLVNKENEIIAPLVGYTNNEVSWKQNFKEYDKNKNILEKSISNEHTEEEIEEIEEEIEEIEEEIEEIEEEIEEIEEEIEEIGEEIEEIEEIEEGIEQIEELEQEIQEMGELQKEIDRSLDRELQLQAVEMDVKLDENKEHSINSNEIHEALKTMAKEINREITDFKYFTLTTEEKLKKTCENIDEVKSYKINDNIEYMFSHNIKMVPFKKQSKNVEWIRISLKETIYLPIDFWNLSNDPFIVACYKKYNHLILGTFDERNGKEYMLGVPDIYRASSKIRANAKGFIQFKCCDDVKLEEGKHGYWIMPIDIR